VGVDHPEQLEIMGHLQGGTVDISQCQSCTSEDTEAGSSSEWPKATKLLSDITKIQLLSCVGPKF
jgi:hypothetical protein